MTNTITFDTDRGRQSGRHVDSWNEENKAETTVWTVEHTTYTSKYEKFPISELLGKQYVSDADAERILKVSERGFYYKSETVVKQAAIQAEVARGVEAFNNRRKGTKSISWQAEGLDYTKFDGHDLNKHYFEATAHCAFFKAFDALGIKFTMKGLKTPAVARKTEDLIGNKNNLRKNVIHNFTAMMNKEYHTSGYCDGIRVTSIHLKKNQAKLLRLFAKLGYKLTDTGTYERATKEQKAFLKQELIDLKDFV